MNNKQKLIFGSGLSTVFFCISKAFAETNAAPMTNVTPEQAGNFFMSFWMQAIYNPSSFAAIGFLMVIAWLCDDLPWPQPKYVKHVTVIVGVLLYWSFTDPDTVAKISKHPFSIYLSYGAVCGAVAYIAHSQVVNRLRALGSKNNETTEQKTA